MLVSTASPPQVAPRRGFTLTEILVAIGIIALLIAILLPALAKALGRAKQAQTSSTMTEFAKACDAYYQEFGKYPGIVPESILALDPKISGMENALLALMGGAIDQDDPLFNDPAFNSSNGWTQVNFSSGPTAFSIKVKPSEMGRGPRVAGKPYSPFFAPKTSELVPAKHVTASGDPDDTVAIPDLLDAWGQPILYLRAMRDVGPLVGDIAVSQFSRGPILPYTNATQFGEFGKSQAPSVLNITNASKDATLAQLIRSPAMGTGADPLNGTARGRFVLISAGQDGIIFSSDQVKKIDATPLTDIVSNSENPAGPDIVKSYDDLIVSGGG